MIVVDASVAVELICRTPASEQMRVKLRSVEFVHAPYLLDIECASAIRRHCRIGALTPAAGRKALDSLRRMPMVRHPHAPYLYRIWELRQNFTAYDACYLALTEALAATLLTRDAALGSAPLLRGGIELV